MGTQEDLMRVADHPYIEEDEINLLDLFMVLVKHKILIITIVFLTGIAAVSISLLMTNIYRSEATIGLRSEDGDRPGALSALGGLGGMMAGGLGLGGAKTLQKLEVILNSRALTNRIIEKYKLMPVIFSDVWDKKKKKWDTDEPPTLQDGYRTLQGLITVKMDTTKGTIRVGLDHEEPQRAKKFVGYYITELSETLREEVLRDTAENMRFFNEQLEKTSDSLLKDKLYSLLAKEIEKDTFARAQKYYSFLVLDPPIVPDRKTRPKRALICILSVIVAFFLAVFLAFIKEYVHRIRIEDESRYQEIVQGMTFRTKKKRRQKA